VRVGFTLLSSHMNIQVMKYEDVPADVALAACKIRLSVSTICSKVCHNGASCSGIDDSKGHWVFLLV
jgi:hypothetical protein